MFAGAFNLFHVLKLLKPYLGRIACITTTLVFSYGGLYYDPRVFGILLLLVVGYIVGWLIDEAK